MTWKNEDPGAEVKRILRMLERTVQMAEHASLTGSMGGGREFAARSYNSILTHLSEIGEIPPALFVPLPENASFDEVGIASAQLAEYLREVLPEGELGQGPSGRKLGDGNVIVSIGGLEEIGELVREHLPEWLRGKRAEREPRQGPAERPSERSQPSEPAPPPPPNAPHSAAGRGEPPSMAYRWLSPQQARIAELRPERREDEAAR